MVSVITRRARHPLLVGLVDRLWWSPATPGGPRRRERILPSARAQIIVSNELPAGVLVGPTSKSADIERRNDVATVGVSFSAGGAQAFLPVSVVELTDVTIELTLVGMAGSVPEYLAEFDAIVALDALEDALVERLRPERISRRVLAAARAIESGVSAGAVPALVGEDRRSLVPEFRRIVGVGPKHYERIRRFSRSIEAIRQLRPRPLAQIAVDLGYADQSHLTREFAGFAGLPPSRLLGDGSETLNHVASDKIFKK